MQSDLKGLSSQEVQERIDKGLINKPLKEPSIWSTVIFSNLFSFYNIIVLTVILILLGFYIKSHDTRLLFDSVGVATVIVINTIIAIFQEIRAKKALAKVSLLIQKEIKVIRDGEIKIIHINDLVQDDLVYIERGDQIPTDGKILKTTRLEINESLLTGESEPIIKKIDDKVLSGSYVISGDGYFQVEKLGVESFAGQITSVAKNYRYVVSPLQRKIGKIIKFLYGVAAGLIVLKIIQNSSSDPFAINYVREYTTIILGLVPQGLILLSTISYALGIYRMSKIGAIVQQSSAIETFSGINVVCMDKTGTLTQNLLSVANLVTFNNDAEKLLGTYANLSSYKNASINALNIYKSIEDAEVIDEMPFSSDTKRSLLKIKVDGKEKILLLGAFDLLKEKVEDKSFLEKFDEDKIKFYRNMLFAEIIPREKNASLENILDEKVEVIPLAVVSISDTARVDSIEAIKLFHDKNIELKILSGDASNTIQAITEKIGWKIDEEHIITGEELEKIDDEEFHNVVAYKKIFARLKPDQKRKIIDTLQKDRYYTAMVGDGVNDLPAVKEADLGIAMQEGSQITKEVADIVLVENKFTLLPHIFDEGNKIVNSISQAAKLFITKNIFITLTTICTVFTTLPFVLTPRKISFVNIFALTFPAFFISILNNDISRKKDFIKDAISSAAISAVTYVLCIYLAFTATNVLFPNISEDIKNTIIVNIITLLSIVNYFIVVYFSNSTKNNKKIFYLLGFILFISFILISIINIDNILFIWFKRIYEIVSIDFQYWIIVFFFSFVGAIIIFIANYIKNGILKD